MCLGFWLSKLKCKKKPLKYSELWVVPMIRFFPFGIGTSVGLEFTMVLMRCTKSPWQRRF